MRGSGGFVVLGVLIAIVGTLAGAVVIGILIDRARQGPPPQPVPREVRYAGAPVEVRFGALTTGRYRAGERLWVQPLENGAAAVFEGAASNRIIGYVDEQVLLTAPTPTR